MYQYQIQTDFSEDEADLVSGRSEVDTAALDAELSNIATSITSIISSLTEIQRSDGELLDGIVTIASLASETLALMTAGAFTVRGPWVTITDYVKGDIVGRPNGTYVCQTAHTSGVFATDLASGYWSAIWDSTTLSASAISFTPTGTIAAANVQDAIAEAASEALQKAQNLSDLVNLVTARSNLSVFSKAEIQGSTGIYAENSGTSEVLRGVYTPAITALVNGMTLILEATGANTGTSVTFTPNFGTIAAASVTKRGGYALAPGDIYGAGHHLLLSYRDDAGGQWDLMNPASPVIPGGGPDITTIPGGVLTLGNYGTIFDLTTAGTVTSIATSTSGGIPLPRGTRFSLRSTLGNTFVHDAASLLMRHSATNTLLPGEMIEFEALGGGVWTEINRRDIPSRERVAFKLALSQLGPF